MVADEWQITCQNLLNRPINPQANPKIQIAQRQVSEYRDGVCPLD